MKFWGIVLLCVASAAVYGIVHDQVTARICVEYFTIGHAPVFDTVLQPNATFTIDENSPLNTVVITP